MSKTFSLILCIIVGSNLIAQTLPDFVPPSPTSSELQKAIEIPVSKSSGLANISIPIHTVQVDGVTLPIGLSYHSAGIKVEQRASNVGLNWSLSCGGSITRNIRGLPDDQDDGYINTDVTIDSTLSYYAQAGNIERILIEYDWNRSLELEPDIFYFSFGGYSGKFFYNQQTNSFLVQSQDDILVEAIGTGTVRIGTILGWKVTTPDGATYFFGVKDVSDNQPIKENNAQWGYTYNSNGQTSPLSGLLDYTTAWALRRIVTPNGREIRITYQSNTSFYYSKGSEANIRSGDVLLGSIQIIRNGLTEYVVDSIIYDTGIVTFEQAANQREDMLGAYAIEKINVYDPSGQMVKCAKLGYDYYTSSDAIPAYLTPVSSNYRGNKRLRLRTVTELGDGNQTLPPYKFDYNSNTLPGVFSTSQDYWGYYNGKPNNGWPFLLTNYNTGYAPDRTVVSDQSEKGLLSRVTFPTGGYVEIEYEGNLGARPTGYDLTYFPDYYDYATRHIGMFRNPALWTGTAYKLPFSVGDDVLSNVSVTISLPGTCPDYAYSSECLYRVRLNNAYIPKGTTVMPPFPSGTTDTLVVEPKYPQLENPNDLENPFMVAFSWDERVAFYGEDYLRMGGSRVRTITRSDGVNTYSTQYEYVDPQGNISGRTKVLPIYSLWLEKKYASLLCSNARVYDPVRLDGSSGEAIVYSWVKERRIGNNAGITYSQYNIVEPGNAFHLPPYPPANDRNYQGGQLVNEYVFDSDSTLLQHRQLTYNFVKDSSSVMGIRGGMHLCMNMLSGDTLTIEEMAVPNIYRNYSSLNKPASETITTYSPAGSLQSKTYFEYTSPEHNQMTAKWSVTSKGDTVRTKLYYPDDATSLVGTDVTAGENLVYEKLGKDDKHRMLEPVVTKSFRNSKLLNTSKVVYDDWGNDIVAIKNIYQSKGSNALENRLTYLKYDALGNPLEAKASDGITIAFIWGYNKSYPVAKIVGATYSQIETVLGAAFDLGAGGLSDTQTNNLRQSIPTGQIYTYKYQVGVGMVEATDPNGKTTKYEYDEFNRLKLTRDSDDNITQQYQYNYYQSN